MSVLGKISEFDPAIEDFETYVERLKLFMTANDIADAKKVPVFLSCIGPRPYKLLKSLLTPEKPEEKGLESLIDTLKSHYAPKPVVISERFKFYQRVQREGESVSSYAAELKNLTVYCEFGDFLNQALRDKFVCGLRNTATQKKLLSEEKLTFDGALKIAVAMETAERNTKDIKGELNQGGSGIHRLSQGPVNAGQRKSKQYPNSKNPQSQKSPRTSHQNQPSGQTGQSVKKKVLCPRCRKGPHPSTNVGTEILSAENVVKLGILRSHVVPQVSSFWRHRRLKMMTIWNHKKRVINRTHSHYSICQAVSLISALNR